MFIPRAHLTGVPLTHPASAVGEGTVLAPVPSAAVSTVVPVPAVAVARVQALDAFRGLTILLMLLVNNIALDTHTPAQLQHAPWNGGVRLADLVFPWFLLAVGVAIPFAAASARRHGLAPWRVDAKILLRAGALLALGMLVDSSIQHTPVFALGVLQIIGLAYLVAAFLYELPLSRRVIIAGGLLAAYWAAIKFLPVPGIGVGVFTEKQNLIQYLNAGLFNSGLRGLPSLVPTAALVMIGALLGDVLRRREWPVAWRLSTLLLAGGGLLLLGVIWNTSLPFSKTFWTPAYIVYTAGSGALLLAGFSLIIDVAGWWQWSYPLLVCGANPLFAYVAPILVKSSVLRVWHIGKLPVEQWLLDGARSHWGPISGGWLYTLGYMGVWWVLLWVLYRKKAYIHL